MHQFSSRQTVEALHPARAAISRKDKFSSLRCLIKSSFLNFFGRPRIFPFALAFSKPLFRKLDHHVKQNELFSPLDWDKVHLLSDVEIDVMASWFDVKIHLQHNFLVQCKGADPKNFLVLIESPSGVRNLQNMELKMGEVSFSGSNFKLNRRDGPFCTYTGDFFRKKEGRITESWEKIGKQDDKSNFYKGILQTVAGVNAFYRRYCNELGRPEKHRIMVHPMIVTNAKILVTRFENLSNEVNLENPEIHEVPWAIYENSVGYGDKSDLGMIRWPTVRKEDGREHETDKKIPFIWILNVKYLEKFLLGPQTLSHKGIILDD